MGYFKVLVSDVNSSTSLNFITLKEVDMKCNQIVISKNADISRLIELLQKHDFFPRCIEWGSVKDSNVKHVLSKGVINILILAGDYSENEASYILKDAALFPASVHVIRCSLSGDKAAFTDSFQMYESVTLSLSDKDAYDDVLYEKLRSLLRADTVLVQ